MTSQSHFVQPPRLATWLLSLFALDDAAEHILGDLLEEFTVSRQNPEFHSPADGIGDRR